MRVLLVLAMLLAALVTPQTALAQYGKSHRAKMNSDPIRYAKYLDRAQTKEAIGKFGAAARSYRRAVMFAPNNEECAKLLLKEADCEFLSEDWSSSYGAYARLLQDYPLYTPYDHVIKRLRTLAGMYAEGEIGLLGIKDHGMAIKIYELMLQEVPVSKNAIQDYLRLAKLQVEMSRRPEAIATLRQMLQHYRRGADLEEASLLLCSLLVAEARDGDGDGRVIRQARRELARFLARHPESARRQEAVELQVETDEIQADRLYGLGQFYVRPAHRRLPAARRYLHDVLRHYPDTKAAGDAKKLLVSVWDDTEVMATAEPAVGSAASADVRTNVKPASTPKIVVPPRKFIPLAKRENVKKWLVPLGDINDLDRNDDAE